MADFDFGRVLTAVMKEQEVGVSELARRLRHKDPRQVRRWKNSHHQPQSYSVVVDIARALGVSVSRLSDPEPGPATAREADVDLTEERRRTAVGDLEDLVEGESGEARSSEDDREGGHQGR